ncbi:E3 ubiquitin-protein ligase UPL7 isoform X2 [Malania oleifera]|uniref:E3 ubiquitin-protein ligase UPL7 isoform X2 n=1 Tax=Malania oleifera TaxID=397392 RepID=UPI0025AE1647|nr:E3 ubiquitin-protein ligase UPL7 isoform X2 [Malania oleifera]XP_057983846.1 E3 ubiquitin-protein ligase UPL7 isoform X2 [Malania oleifera]
MGEHRKHQVSLRGASAKEITRDALLEKVSQERELRNYARQAARAALFIQRVWRRHYIVKMVALQLQQEWASLANHRAAKVSRSWISSNLLRPFLFFITYLSIRHEKIRTGDIDCMHNCFKILLESINSTDSMKNFCSLATGTLEERRTWTYQSRKLIFLCSFILAQCDSLHQEDQGVVTLSSLGIRVVVALTDLKGWKSITNEDIQDADIAVKDLVRFMGSRKSGLYSCIRRYINNLGSSYSSKLCSVAQLDDRFLITASALTLALRPFHVLNFDVNDPASSDLLCAAEQYCVFVLTIPWLLLSLPSVLLPALKHKSVLSPCFRTLVIFKDKILADMSKMEQLKVPSCSKVVPHVGWALANIICLVTESEINSLDPRRFTQSVDYASYVQVVIIYAESFLAWLENVGWTRNENQELLFAIGSSAEPIDVIMHETDTTYRPLKVSYIDLFRPICEQWHLSKLLAVLKQDACIHDADTLPDPNLEVKLELLDIAYFYSYMLRIFSLLNPAVGSLPVLNMLSFTPGFLVDLWGALESSLFPSNAHTSEEGICSSKISENKSSGAFVKKQKWATKDGGNKFVSVLHKITGRSLVDFDSTDSINSQPMPSCSGEDSCDVWDIESFRHGVQGISKDISCQLHLFCATYSHLLLVLDDIEFYEKQVPFTLEQQRRITSMLNTLVYNGLSNGSCEQNKTLMDAAVRCLHLLYERDCRHQFCPPALWLSPAIKSRPPIAAAARTHEIFSANLVLDDGVTIPSMGSVITTTPHVFPFDERVQMFREFIKMDKVSRRMAGEVAGPGPGSVEIVIRRDHIVEDGFRQLNSLGSRLKSSIHVSFVSECGLPEAGLDYGGLSKEFLTDVAKAAFAPQYGLFSQSSTSDGLLIPNTAAKFLDNGIQMIEFLGRVVGKALYEGILLDYYFSHVFVQKLLGRYSFLDELSTLDPELYRNLMYVKLYDGDVKELSLDFTINEESYGKHHVIELKPGGKDVSVTNENKLQYIHAIADYKLNRQLLPLSNAFYRGLTDLISPSWLKLFNASEFNQLLSGGNHDIDIDDLRNNTRYTGGYSEGSRTVKLFWEVVAGFEPKERCMLLKFVTSCSRAPLLGFKHLQPTFTIHKVACDVPVWAMIGGQDVERLPSASTCYNTLKLPTYKRPSTMRAKLLYAINSNAGFELS